MQSILVKMKRLIKSRTRPYVNRLYIRQSQQGNDGLVFRSGQVDLGSTFITTFTTFKHYLKTKFCAFLCKNWFMLLPYHLQQHTIILWNKIAHFVKKNIKNDQEISKDHFVKCTYDIFAYKPKACGGPRKCQGMKERFEGQLGVRLCKLGFKFLF